MDAIITFVNAKLALVENPTGDLRVKDWPLMNGPEIVLMLTAIYLLIVKCGPSFMTDKPALKTTCLMVVYNFSMVGFSLWMLLRGIVLMFRKSFALICQPVDTSLTPLGYTEASLSWWFFISKLIEFLDTILFILRKKNKQISFLHVYHHSTLPIVCWYVAKYAPGAEKLYIGSCNTFVHIIMYTYYGLAAFGPKFQRFLWWKKYLTSLQMIQFVTTSVRCFLSAMSGPNCYPRWLNLANVLYSMSFFFLFFDFYRRSYGIRVRCRLKSS